jgi:hypothetical protein
LTVYRVKNGNGKQLSNKKLAVVLHIAVRARDSTFKC